MFTIIITTTIHDINSIITYVSVKEELILHSISVIIFLAILSTCFAALLLACSKFSSKNEQTFATSEENDKYNEKDFKLQSGLFLSAAVFVIYTGEILLLLPFALALEQLKIYVLIQAIIFLFIMILSLGFAIQKNMLRFR